MCTYCKFSKTIARPTIFFIRCLGLSYQCRQLPGEDLSVPLFAKHAHERLPQGCDDQPSSLCIRGLLHRLLYRQQLRRETSWRRLQLHHGQYRIPAGFRNDGNNDSPKHGDDNTSSNDCNNNSGDYCCSVQCLCPRRSRMSGEEFV